MSRKSAEVWLTEYGVCHQNHINKAIHWICVPSIAMSLVAVLWALPVPWSLENGPRWLNWSLPVILAALVFYVRLSRSLALGMAAWAAITVALIQWYEAYATWPIWIPAVAILLIAWIAQFIGHAIEGKRPSFLDDLQFLLIGPIWLLDDLYRRLGMRRE